MYEFNLSDVLSKIILYPPFFVLEWISSHLSCCFFLNKDNFPFETRSSESVYSSGRPVVSSRGFDDVSIFWTHVWLISYPARTSMNFSVIWQPFNLRPLPRILHTNWVEVYTTLSILWYIGNVCVKGLLNPLLYGNRLYVSKGYNVAFEFVVHH